MLILVLFIWFINLNNSVLKSLGNQFFFIRSEILELTQKELALKLNLTPAYISYLETGLRIPSNKVVNKVFKIAGNSKAKDSSEHLNNLKILQVEAKKISKNKMSPEGDTTLKLKEDGNYKLVTLKKKVKENPKDISLIEEMIRFLIEKSKFKEAKTFLLESLIKIDKEEEQKWLEAFYFELQGNFTLSEQLLKEAITIFEKNNTYLSDEDKRRKIANLLFRLSSNYFKAGQYLYQHKLPKNTNDPTYKEVRKEIKNKFDLVLETHKEVRKNYEDPFYQMDFANVYFWLALNEEENKKEHWICYISEIRKALLLNYSNHNLFSKFLIISSFSFLARAYTNLALIELEENKSNITSSLKLVEEGELIFVQNIPLQISIENRQFYKFYFNYACFYSLKAKIANLVDQNISESLEFCLLGLKKCFECDSKNDLKLFEEDFVKSNNLEFFRSKLELANIQDLKVKITNLDLKGDK